jgi:hypothetical protein
VTLDKVCESIPEKDDGGQQTGNQSTINPEDNVYGAQISNRAEERNENEFDDGLREKK